MRLLLDTHVYLWWLSDDPRMPDDVANRIGDTATLVHISAASIWEAAIKAGLGKLELDGADLVAEIPANGFDELPVTGRHAAAAGALPQHHPDPFDRMLIAQAQLEDLTLVTADSRMDAYDVAILEVVR